MSRPRESPTTRAAGAPAFLVALGPPRAERVVSCRDAHRTRTGEGLDTSIAALIEAADRGDESAAAPLFTALYSELHLLAKRQLARHALPASLGATTLLHEAYLDMAAREVSFPDRPRFMSYAARVMRGLIIDHARKHQAHKRGGLFEITSLGTDAAAGGLDEREVARLTELGHALDALASTDPALAAVVDLKYFCGFSFAEIATMQDVTERTVQRRWERARLFLHRTLRTTPL